MENARLLAIIKNWPERYAVTHVIFDGPRSDGTFICEIYPLAVNGGLCYRDQLSATFTRLCNMQHWVNQTSCKFENYLNLVNGILKGPKSGKTSSFYMQLVLDDIARLLEVDPRKDIIPPEPIRRRTIINHAR
ncbi:MAG: hypothetical protein UT15_C0009G0006 [Berkelbacteria bacterium GW2011_GWA1_39_10]|uniref:Uncharacterized protein n=1 Tax=Berkelbacteria bacterium GW2011_GWA1_39_10 TaxID=1618332 RepID=A0A0G0LRE7_9BACT|nr:MAG: hypothetical protein UT15_C0009G0006 [Berkelbacteria bacterium GW2011_GWA1_39_10]